MKFRLKNVGRIHKDSEIDINGITVLCGDNGTGKSTIGKALYCAFSTFHDYEEKILEERVESIYRFIRVFGNLRLIPRSKMQWIKNRVRDFVATYPCDKRSEAIDQLLYEVLGEKADDIDQTVRVRIQDSLDANDLDILKAIASRNIEAEFGSQLGHINYADHNSEIELSIKNEKISFSVDEEQKIEITEKINLIKDIIYIDDPYTLDDMTEGAFPRGGGHRHELVRKLIRNSSENVSAVDDVIANNRLEKIYEKLDTIGIGSLVSDPETGFVYSEKGLKKGVSVVNISTGVKAFVILKSLLQKGFLEDNGIVILDEPETHLNPESMEVYAEIVVLLHELLGINFVISTHSTDYISFIEYFTKKYNVEDKTKIYLLEKNSKDFTTEIRDISGDLEQIYSKLAKPFLRISEELDYLDEKN
ncbi:AAA domain-containing protein, putative AbiEii toxin, Type IV TA system [Lachnospiraceae bacterium]|nr:AAA domain-containing protein, putative AbiEii toxin, Type IV TA system [Lachnospiraceae bacterium]